MQSQNKERSRKRYPGSCTQEAQRHDWRSLLRIFRQTRLRLKWGSPTQQPWSLHMIEQGPCAGAAQAYFCILYQISIQFLDAFSRAPHGENNFVFLIQLRYINVDAISRFFRMLTLKNVLVQVCTCLDKNISSISRIQGSWDGLRSSISRIQGSWDGLIFSISRIPGS